ncbi:MAG: hypothetical protein AB8B83_02665 [Bdellovibrionales bacterium]
MTEDNVSKDASGAVKPDEAQDTKSNLSKTTKSILGIPKENYIKIAYLTLIAACILGFIAVFVSAISGLSTLVSLAGIVLVLAGFFMYGPEFSDAQLSHFKFVGVIFVATFILGVILSAVLGGVAIANYIVSSSLSIAVLTVLYCGFKLNEDRKEVTKDNFVNQLKSLKP